MQWRLAQLSNAAQRSEMSGWLPAVGRTPPPRRSNTFEARLFGIIFNRASVWN